MSLEHHYYVNKLLPSANDDLFNFDMSRIHFRAPRSVSAMQKKALIRDGESIFDVFKFISSEGIQFPLDQVSELGTMVSSDFEIEKLAITVRKQLGLGFGPLPNLIEGLELAGVFVVFLTIGDDVSIDAYSTNMRGRNVICVCPHDSSSRMRFSVAHELGHLLMHEYTDGSAAQEKEANRFAGAFLLPWKSFVDDCPRKWNLEAFIQLKKKWKVSIGAMLYRAKDLNIFSDGMYRRALKGFYQHVDRRQEPAEPEFDKPFLFNESVRILFENGVQYSDFERKLLISPSRLFEICKRQSLNTALCDNLFQVSPKGKQLECSIDFLQRVKVVD